jgi:hypothetical protein
MSLANRSPSRTSRAVLPGEFAALEQIVNAVFQVLPGLVGRNRSNRLAPVVLLIALIMVPIESPQRADETHTMIRWRVKSPLSNTMERGLSRMESSSYKGVLMAAAAIVPHLLVQPELWHRKGVRHLRGKSSVSVIDDHRVNSQYLTARATTNARLVGSR